MNIKISDASASQLSEFAQLRYGLDVHFRQGKDKILAAMQAVGFTGDEIEMDGPEAPVEGQTGKAVPEAKTITADQGTSRIKNRRMVELEIMEQDLPGTTFGTEPVPVTLNGKLMYVPRGQRVRIPYEYYLVLQKAKYRQYAPPPNEYTPVGEARDVPRFPITIYSIDPEPAKDQAA